MEIAVCCLWCEYTSHNTVMAVEDGNDNVKVFNLDKDSDEGL